MLVKRVWIEPAPEVNFDPTSDSADVLVELENDELWQAHFVTLPHLQQEMQISLNVARDYKDLLTATQFITVDTPHVIVERLTVDVIEDVVDNLMALGVFETVFNIFERSEPSDNGKGGKAA